MPAEEAAEFHTTSLIKDKADEMDVKQKTEEIQKMLNPQTAVVSENKMPNQSDAPACDNCGSIMVRSGACYKCDNCGNTSGCG